VDRTGGRDRVGFLPPVLFVQSWLRRRHLAYPLK